MEQTQKILTTLDHVVGQIANLTEIVQGHTKKFDLIDNRFDFLETAMARGFADVYKKFDEVDAKFAKVDNAFDELRSDMNFRFDGVNRRLDDLATYRVRTEVHEKLERRVTKLEEKVGI